MSDLAVEPVLSAKDDSRTSVSYADDDSSSWKNNNNGEVRVRWHSFSVNSEVAPPMQLRHSSTSFPRNPEIPCALAAPTINAAMGMLRSTRKSREDGTDESANQAPMASAFPVLVDELERKSVNSVASLSSSSPYEACENSKDRCSGEKAFEKLETMSLDDIEAKVRHELSKHEPVEALKPGEEKPFSIRNMLEMIRALAVRNRILTRDMEESNKLTEREREVYQDQIARLRATVEEQNQIIRDCHSQEVHRLFCN